MENGSIYSLLIGIGNYQNFKMTDLPTYKKDVELIQNSLIKNIGCKKENIRIMIGENKNGLVNIRDFSKGIKTFFQMLNKNDTFIFYFSGHGSNNKLLFSDGVISLQSIVDFINKISAKNKILILDCCNSGDFYLEEEKDLEADDLLEDFVGKGIAVLASSSKDGVARVGKNKECSLFTELLCEVIKRKNRTKDRWVSLEEIFFETKEIIDCWNIKNPDLKQYPTFRKNMLGTIYFKVQENEYKTQPVLKWKNELYEVRKVESIHNLKEKRYCVYVIYDSEKKDISLVSQKIYKTLKYKIMFTNLLKTFIFGSAKIDAVWCYFAKDESDIINHLYYCHTIFSPDSNLQKKYYKKERNNAEYYDHVFISYNSSYSFIKERLQCKKGKEEYKAEVQQYLMYFINEAEFYIKNINEFRNNVITKKELDEILLQWPKKIKSTYLKFSDIENAPNELYIWVQEVDNLAGCVLDMALFIENMKNKLTLEECNDWILKNTINRYYASLEKLKIFE